MILLLIGATAFDFSTDKIPNWYILLATSILLAHKIIQDNGIDLFGTLFSILFPILVLFPLFALGFLGAADVKLFGMLGICFSFKEVMLVFTISLLKRHLLQDFPGGPAAKTLHSQCRGPGFDPWSGNYIPQASTRSSSAKQPKILHSRWLFPEI